MRYLTLGEVVTLHQRVLAQSGGAAGVRDLGLLESALAQLKATFDGIDLHPTLIEKAAAFGFALVANHAFVDGNKRIGHEGASHSLWTNPANGGRSRSPPYRDSESLGPQDLSKPWESRIWIESIPLSNVAAKPRRAA